MGQTTSTSTSVPPLVFAKHIPEFVLFGDSITQFSHAGWGALLADWGQRRFEVRVKGYGGYNTNYAKPVMKDLIKLGVWRNPRLVTIFFGANDATVDSSIQHVDFETYKSNLRELVATAKAQKYVDDDGKLHDPYIVLITPPPVDQSRTSPDRKYDNAKKYAEGVIAVSKELGVLSIDLFNVMVARNDWKLFLSDGLHLSLPGSVVLADQLKELIRRSCPDVNPESDRVLMEFPEWSKLDPKKYEEQLAL